MRWIKQQTGNQHIWWCRIDLASKRDIESFADWVKSNFKRVDILVNNAGLLGLREHTLTENGFEMHMGVNHLAHFYLTYLLWDLLKHSERLRIVNVSAKLHKLNIMEPSRPIELDQHMDGLYHNAQNP